MQNTLQQALNNITEFFISDITKEGKQYCAKRCIQALINHFEQWFEKDVFIRYI